MTMKDKEVKVIPYTDLLRNATEKYMKKKEELRILFNRKAFGVSFSGIEDSNDEYKMPSKTAKLRNLDHINTIIDALDRWKSGLIPNDNKLVYDWLTRYEIFYRNVNGEIEPYLEVFKDSCDKEVVAEPKIFDIIYDEHKNIGHKGVTQTKNKIREKYHSITEWMVNIFVQQICPVCAITRNKPKKRQVHIHLSNQKNLGQGFKLI